MGIYDSVIVNCPECGHPTEFQSKQAPGGPTMETYSLDDAPDTVLADIAGETAKCSKCQTVFCLTRTSRLVLMPVKISQNKG